MKARRKRKNNAKRIGKSSKQNSRKKAKQNPVDYQQLEAKNLLSVNVGVQFDATALDPNEFEIVQPSIAGDVGTDHVVELINGSYRVYDRAGTLLEEQEFNEFWQDAGAEFPDTALLGDARVVFDPATERWFATTFAPQVFGGIINGPFNIVAVSVSSDPTDGWRSVQFDSSPGNFTIERASSLSIDANALYVTVDVQDPSNSPGTQAIFAFPKNDLLGVFPSVDNLHRFDSLDQNVYGQQIQIGRENGDIDGRASGIAAFANGGNTLSKVDLVGDLSGNGNVTLSRVDISVPTYLPGPDGRQPDGSFPLASSSPLFTSGAYSANGYLWAVHSVLGSSGNSALRWYQINETTNEVANTGLFDNPDVDFIAPSIAVNRFGTGVSIGFTATGPDLAPSAFTAHAFVQNTTGQTPEVNFSFPTQLLDQGVEGYERFDPFTGQNAWSIYSATVVDPTDEFSFWNFNQVATENDTWQIHVAEARIFDISPTIETGAEDNVIVLRQSDQDSRWIELIVDGNLENVYEMTALDELTIIAGDGDDLIVIDQTFGQVFGEQLIQVFGGGGNDSIRYVDNFNHDFNINGNNTGVVDGTIRFSEIENVAGSSGNDRFTIQTTGTDWIIEGGAGNDVFFVAPSATGTLELLGQAGNDSYEVPLASISNILIVDSVDAEFDSVLGYAGNDGNVITLDGDLITIDDIDVSALATYVGIESVDLDANAGDDEFRILSTTGPVTVVGGSGNDTFFVSSDAPTNVGDTSGIADSLTIDGGVGVSRLVVSNVAGPVSDVVVTDGQISGFTANPINFIGNFASLDGQAGITLLGSDSAGQDTFDIKTLKATDSIEIFAGAGNDILTVRRLVDGKVYLDGQDGIDTFRTTAAGHARTINYTDSGTDGARDRIALSLTDLADDFLLSNEQINLLGELFLWDETIERVILDTRAGEDTVRLGNTDSQFVTLNLGDGNDEVIVFNSLGIDGLRINAGAGNDSFDFRGGQFDTFVNAFGEAGSDDFFVSSASFTPGRLDGGDGGDSVIVDFSRRAGRRIDASDSGDSGSDSLVVRGTAFIDRVDLLSGAAIRSGEPVVFNSQTERLTVDTRSNFDVLNVFGLSVASTNVLTRGGTDVVNVFRTVTPSNVDTVDLVVDLGNGNDTASVTSVAANTNVFVFGQSGSDFINVGSTLAQDNGNLNGISGGLRLRGGTGLDTVYINDNQATANYAYFLTDSVLTNLVRSASANRTLFSAVRYDEVERVRFDASQGDNFTSLVSSPTTEFIVDGNASDDFLFVTGDDDDRELTAGTQSGRYRFFDGSRDVTFVSYNGFVS